MAAEVLSQAGVRTEVFDAMPSVGRKFLLAGVGGMNITHAEAREQFLGRYGRRQKEIAALLGEFDADALRAWIHGLGIDTFVGSSGRVFPSDMKAAPLLRAWLSACASKACSSTPAAVGWAGTRTVRWTSRAPPSACRYAPTP